MIGSKQIIATPAAANRQPARSSHARGRGTNPSKQAEESRRGGRARRKREKVGKKIALVLIPPKKGRRE